MAKSFEDMHWQEWPSELIELHAAAQAAWEAYAALDEILSNRPRAVLNHDVTRSTLIELAGRAYALLRDLRAEGMRQLAAWEIAQGQLAGARCISCGWHGVHNPNEGSDCPSCGAVALVGDKDEEVKVLHQN